MQVFRKSIFLILYAFLVTTAFSQQIDSLLAIHHLADPQEKLFMHFDRNYYAPGDTIWFKGYLFQGLDRSRNSRNFYAELRDEKGALIDFKTAPVVFSGAAGSFQVPDSFPKNVAYVRAYTANMLNGDTSFLFVKALKIIHPTKKQVLKTTIPPTEIKFLPEGGDMIAGLINNVAFMASVGETPVYVKGIVKDAAGKQVSSFEAAHDGMGAFNLLPQADQTYTAVWKDEKGKEYTTPLPVAKSSGITLQVSDGENGKNYAIQRLPGASPELMNLTVIAIQNQQLVYQAAINLSVKEAIKTQIATSELPTGIVQITVLDKQQRPVAERITFVNNNNFEFDADAWLTEINPAARSLNRGEVKIADTVGANLSLSITDADLDIPEANHENIVTRMLMTGELRGRIANPYYYFFSTADSDAYHLDLVMLTHGWRRYNWPELLAGKVSPPRFSETDFLTLKGKVITSGGVFEQGLKLNGFLRTADSASNFVSFDLDRNGNIFIPGYLFYDTARLYLQFSDKNRLFEPSMLSLSNGLLEQSQLPPAVALHRFNPYEPDTSLANLIYKNSLVQQKMAAKRFKDAKVLENVTVTAKAKTTLEKMEQTYVGALFAGDGRGFDVINDRTAIGSFSIFQYLQGKVAGLQITTGGANPQLSWRGGAPALYLNEMQADVSQISSLNMADVAYIKVLSPGSAGAVRNSGSGVISIYTRKGGDRVSSPEDSKIGVYKLRGYSPLKQFISPDYSVAGADAFYDDVRTTLYWNPFILLEKNKKRVKFQFYNNDVTTRFRIVMEGINEEGKLIHVEKVVSKN